MSALSHVAAFDDAPFERSHRGDVLVVGTVYANTRLDGILCGKVRRDGVNATRTLIRLIEESRFAGHIQVVLIQGIAFAGFNVIDIQCLHERLALPVVAVVRKEPDFEGIKAALLGNVRGGRRKWALIEKAGPVEEVEGVFVQRAGISIDGVSQLINKLAIHSKLPEPLRTAHLIAGGVTVGESRHRA